MSKFAFKLTAIVAIISVRFGRFAQARRTAMAANPPESRLTSFAAGSSKAKVACLFGEPRNETPRVCAPLSLSLPPYLLLSGAQERQVLIVVLVCLLACGVVVLLVMMFLLQHMLV